MTAWISRLLTPLSRPVSVALVFLLTSGCIRTDTRMYFQTLGISGDQWSRIHQECAYEAEKATASARIPTNYGWKRIYVMCVELKGATYVGYIRLPEEQWVKIKDFCNKEADTAVAGVGVSRRRDEVHAARKLECIKRNVTVHEEIELS